MGDFVAQRWVAPLACAQSSLKEVSIHQFCWRSTDSVRLKQRRRLPGQVQRSNHVFVLFSVDAMCLYLECTARCQFRHVSELLPMLNSHPRQPLKRIGRRKFHYPQPQRNRHDRPVVEGGKMIGFTRSLQLKSKRFELLLKSKSFSQLDIWLSRNIGSQVHFRSNTFSHAFLHGNCIFSRIFLVFSGILCSLFSACWVLWSSGLLVPWSSGLGPMVFWSFRPKVQGLQCRAVFQFPAASLFWPAVSRASWSSRPVVAWPPHPCSVRLLFWFSSPVVLRSPDALVVWSSTTQFLGLLVLWSSRSLVL